MVRDEYGIVHERGVDYGDEDEYVPDGTPAKWWTLCDAVMFGRLIRETTVTCLVCASGWDWRDRFWG